MKNIVFIFFMLNAACLFGQSVGINNDGTTANPSAMLDVKSTGKGLLIPRMSKAQKNAIVTPATGLLVFQNAPDSVGFHYYDGAKWLYLDAVTKDWAITGNTNTDTAVNFFGTTNDMPMRFKLNNVWAGQWDIAKQNYFIGDFAGKSNRTGTKNIGMGAGVLANMNAGSKNIALGDSALYNHLKGNRNIAIGPLALKNSDSATGQIAIGDGSLAAYKNNYTDPPPYTTIWSQNIAIGNLALGSAEKGGGNYAIGAGALLNFNNSEFCENIAFGFNSQASNLTGRCNTSLGSRTMVYFRKGSSNTAVGCGAMSNIDSCSGNLALGVFALENNKTGNNNIAIGLKAASGLDSASNNIAIGRYTLNDNTYGNNNIAIGDSSGYFSYIGNDNIFLGKKAGYNTNTGSENTFIGNNAGLQAIRGSANTYVGHNVNGKPFTGGTQTGNIGYSNVALGNNAFYNNKQGYENIAIGDSSAYNNIDGNSNIAIGKWAMLKNTSADLNIAIGRNSLASNKINTGKIAIGHFALQNDSISSIGGSFAPNVAVGNNSLSRLGRGYDNVALGDGAGNTVTDGEYNVFLGNAAYAGIATGKDTAKFNIIIGSGTMFQSKGSTFNTIIGVGSNGVSNPPTINAFGNTMLGGLSYSVSSANLNTLIGFNTKSTGNAFLTNAAAFGANAQVDTSNALVLGSISGINSATNNTNVAIGTTKPKAALHITRGSAGNSSTMPPSRLFLMEDNVNNYMQLLAPNANETGIIAGNASTLVKGAIVFTADSSMHLKAGGGINRVVIDNGGNVGIGNIVATSLLQVTGSIASPLTTTTSAITLNNSHRTLIINAAAAIAVSLPAANTCSGREYIIVNQDAFAHTITSYKDFTNANATVIPVTGSITLQSDGNNWYRIR